MASVTDVFDLIDDLNDIIFALNQSQTSEDARFVLASMNLDNSSDYGNMTPYITECEQAFDDLYVTLENNGSYLAEDDVNRAVDNLHQYIKTHWWQFGSRADSREPIFELPEPLLLNMYDYER